jgi:hypothetical protein
MVLSDAMKYNYIGGIGICLVTQMIQIKIANRRYIRIGRYLLVAGAVLMLLLGGLGTARADSGKPLGGPIVVAQTPARGAEQVALDAAISIIWSQAMSPDSTFVLSGPQGIVPGAFTYDEISFTVTFLPASDLSPSIRYDGVVEGQVDAQGRVQLEPVRWHFSTVTPTSVSLVEFSARRGVEETWWWSAWPWMMLLVSLFSLIGFVRVWKQRPGYGMEGSE